MNSSTSSSELSYGRFILVALLCLAVLTIAALGATRFLSGRLIGGDAAWTSWSLAQKQMAAAQIEGPKLIFISGSSGNFGYSAQQLGEALGVNAVNLASHAGLGVPYFAYLASRNAGPGDVVVLPLEYEMYERNSLQDEAIDPDELVFSPLAYQEYDRFILTKHTVNADFQSGMGLFGFLSLGEKVQYLRVFPIASFLAAATQFLSGEQFERPDTGYWLYDIDRFGDIDVPETRRRDASRALGSARKADDRRLRLSEQSVRYLTALRDELHARGAQLILTQPPLHEFTSLSPEAIRALASQLEARGLDYHFLAEDNRIPAEMMLDTRYHPGRWGRRVATARLAILLCDIVDFSPLAAPGEACTPTRIAEQRAWSEAGRTMMTFVQENSLSTIRYSAGNSYPLRRSAGHRGAAFDVIVPTGCRSQLNFQLRAEIPEARISVQLDGDEVLSHVFDQLTGSGVPALWSGAVELPDHARERVNVRFIADRWNSQPNDTSMSFVSLFRHSDCDETPALQD
ncbi:SGNH/GDSL hydrolase family protein [Maricaulis salignorans]|uniref:Uncharacterized protein n=1 Tax=Maricaulis salignorans TaxID=144026 RepID=A0A1G9MS70_9PROT|nr:hypothetical protein [Maricaulis salignorans]SDL77156.1 hypothetical protein SAMN04488568_10293 [Maricaulis salignorans]